MFWKHGACSLASAPTVGPRSQEHGPLVSQPDAGDSRSFFKTSQWLTLLGKPCRGLETGEDVGRWSLTDMTAPAAGPAPAPPALSEQTHHYSATL